MGINCIAFYLSCHRDEQVLDLNMVLIVFSLKKKKIPHKVSNMWKEKANERMEL